MTALPPHDLDIERSTLGSVFVKPTLFADLAFSLRADDFFLPAHRAIWEAMGRVARRGLTVDPIIVAEEMKATGEHRRLETEGYLLDLAGDVPTAERGSEYATLVGELAGSRRLITLCSEVASRAYGRVRLPGLIEELTREAARLVVHSPGDLTNAADLVEAFVQELGTRCESKNQISGLRTSIEGLDEITYGFDPGDLVVVAADPGGGKTALAMQIAILLAVLDGGSAFVCNMEMSKQALLERTVAYLTGINSWNLRTGKLTRGDMSGVYDVNAQIAAGALYLQDKLFTMPQIVTRAREWRVRHPNHRGVVVVDYLQRIRGGRGDNRVEQIGEWTSALKELATALEVPVLLLSQLNRAPSKDKRPPTMRDLRESGDIEADADTVLLIHNPGKTEDGGVDLILDKNRKGPCRVVSAHWTARNYRFSNVANESPQQQELPGAA